MSQEKEMVLAQPESRRTIRIYEVNKPYAYAMVTEDTVSRQLRYEVVEPTLTDDDRAHLERIRGILIETLDVTLRELGEPDKVEAFLRTKIEDIVKKFRISVDGDRLDKLFHYILRDYVGFGKIDVMMRDPEIEDVSCNGFGVPVYIWHREFESIPSNVMFEREDELDSFIIRLAYRTGRMISIAQPILDSTLPDGSRIQMTLGKEVTKGGSTFTIRKFKADPLTIVDMVRFKTVSSEIAAYFWFVIENRCGVFVCGPVASGKTTMLNCLSNFIKPDMKIVTIEDTPEIQIYHKNWIRSVTRVGIGGRSDGGEISLFDLLRAAMRQRPDYIIVGEVRGQEAYTLFQAMATGHLGMSTLHADSVAAAIHRLETEPMNIPRTLVAGMDILTIQHRLEVDGRPARRTITVTEIVGIDPGTNDMITNEVFAYEPKTDTFRYVGRSYTLEKIAKRTGMSLADIRKDLDNRKALLDWMLKKGIRSFRDVTEFIRSYLADPEVVLKLVRVGA